MSDKIAVAFLLREIGVRCEQLDYNLELATLDEAVATDARDAAIAAAAALVLQLEQYDKATAADAP